MVGDFILWLKTFLRQNLFCIHHYVWKGPLDFRYEICDKCGKLKRNNMGNSESQKVNIQGESLNLTTRVRSFSLKWKRMPKGIHGQRNRFCFRIMSPNIQ